MSMEPKQPIKTPEEILAEIQNMSEMDHLGLTLKAENDPIFRNKLDAVHGLIACWNCGRSMQKPAFINNIKGKGTNTMNLRCMCGELTVIKF